MAVFSFDIVSEIDKAEMNNVFAMTEKEISNRYDFKGTPASIDWLDDKTGFKIVGSNDWQIESIIDIIRKKLASRNQSSKVLDLSEEVNVANMHATKKVPFISKLDQDKAKMITKLLREETPKLKALIQGDTVRVSGSSKDELQTAMNIINKRDFDFPITFNNYR